MYGFFFNMKDFVKCYVGFRYGLCSEKVYILLEMKIIGMLNYLQCCCIFKGFFYFLVGGKGFL